MIYKIWKKVSTTGCEMGDGSDTRKTEIKFYVIPYTESKEFGEHRASDYGDQDYSYSVSYSCLGKFETSEVKDLMKKLGEALENERPTRRQDKEAPVEQEKSQPRRA
jgi:hypothetical protein